MKKNFKKKKNLLFNRSAEVPEAYRVLVEEVENHSREPVVVPVTVNEEQALQVLEPRNGKVRGHDGLHSLHAGNADTDVGSLDNVQGKVGIGKMIFLYGGTKT